jgi:uncharacterized membrane protein YdjX (TVP38/TMEM64 family)
VSTVGSSVRSGTRVRLVLVFLAVVVVAAVALFPELQKAGRSGLIELSELGRLAPLVLIALYSLGAALLLPVFWLDLAAGAHFGFLRGVLWVHIAAIVASVAAYFVGRFVFRGLVEQLVHRNPKLARLDQAVARDGWRLVFLTRLSPVFSFSILGVVYGASRVRFWPYFLATAAGMLPGTVLYVYAGDMAGDLSGAPGHPTKPPFQWAFEVAGFVATVVLVIYVTRRAQRVLSAKLEDVEGFSSGS